MKRIPAAYPFTLPFAERFPSWHTAVKYLIHESKLAENVHNYSQSDCAVLASRSIICFNALALNMSVTGCYTLIVSRTLCREIDIISPHLDQFICRKYGKVVGLYMCLRIRKKLVYGFHKCRSIVCAWHFQKESIWIKPKVLYVIIYHAMAKLLCRW